MKIRSILLSFFIVCFTSCETMKKTVKDSYKYEMYIDYKNISYQGQNRFQTLYLEIDSTNGMWYTGKLILDNKDTLLLRGFEKGSHYVTRYKETNSDEYGNLEIWSRVNIGQIPDSISILARTGNGLIKEDTQLYRRARRGCF